MVATSYNRGHKVYYNEELGEWLYCDDNSSTSVERPCARCGRMATNEGYDSCVGHIEGATSVCCGHGIKKPIMKWEE